MASIDSLGERVRLLVDYRDQGNATAAAKRAGMPVATLDRILRGVVTSPRRDALERIAKAYDVSIDWLLTGASAEHPRDAREALRLWASVVYELQLTPALQVAVLDLPTALDDFCDLLDLAPEILAEQRTHAILAFRDALRRAIEAHGRPSVREALESRADMIALRLSHAAEGVGSGAKNASAGYRVWVGDPAPIFRRGGKYAIDWGAESFASPRSGVPLPVGGEYHDRGASGAMKEPSPHPQPVTDPDEVLALKRSHLDTTTPPKRPKPAAKRRGAPPKRESKRRRGGSK